MGIDTGNSMINRTLNLIITLLSDFTDSWSTVSAEMVALSLAHPGIKQTEMAAKLKIKQSAVSQRQKRARMSHIQGVLEYYQEIIKELKTS